MSIDTDVMFSGMRIVGARDDEYYGGDVRNYGRSFIVTLLSKNIVCWLKRNTFCSPGYKLVQEYFMTLLREVSLQYRFQGLWE